jgi:hypothetical protein
LGGKFDAYLFLKPSPYEVFINIFGDTGLNWHDLMPVLLWQNLLVLNGLHSGLIMPLM